MIIPMRCMNCGKLLADKWLWYQAQLQQAEGKRTYYDGSELAPKTKEAEVMAQLGLTRYCCRKVLLTHVDLIHKL
uniref:Uncharacterized protein n=1 Tax=viral metagenome TaxID=1070528 RepID=A0A6C0E6G3_9ZZZZ